MVDRDENGKVKKGSVLNPNGRPKRTDEEKYMSVILAIATPTRFQIATEKQMRKAENGDLEAYKYLCKLLGLEVDRKQLSDADGNPLTFIIQQRPSDDNKKD